MNTAQKTIWKFQLSYGDNILLLPKESEVLHVDSQNDIVCLWVLVDPYADIISRTFVVVGTGSCIPDWDQLNHIGSLKLNNDSLIFHVFEKRSRL